MTFRNPSFQNKAPTTFQAGDTAGLAMWVKQRQSDNNLQDLVWGRIKDTGVNFIVEGYQTQWTSTTFSSKWVRIPCRRLLDAQLLLGQVMSPLDFALNKIEEDNNCPQ